MDSPPPSPQPAPESAPFPKEDPIERLPPEARQACQCFRETGNVEVLEPVIVAILNDFIPTKSARPLQELPGETRLVEDLGFDSLAITEVVFFTEELFQISISNEEILQVRTLDDLRGFVRKKVAPPTAG